MATNVFNNTVATASTACVFFAPRNTRHLYDKAADQQPYDVVQVLSIGSPFRYNIPSFDLLAVEMRQFRVKGYTEEDQEEQYDIFVCNHPARGLDRASACFGNWWMTIKDATIIEVSEFGLSVEVSGLKLVPQGVMVVWDWESEIDNDESASDYDPVSSDENVNPDMHSDEAEGCDSNDDGLCQTHVITFKCIGATHHSDSQEVLKRVSMMSDQSSVQVELCIDSDNPYDSRAIAFRCFDTTIGYVVREALDSVHAAIAEKKILYVKLAWAKYLVSWSRSGPGYYAGINICIKGEWPSIVCKCRSTR